MRFLSLMLVVVLLVCCGLSEGHAGPNQYPANEVPMYGHITKTPAMLVADKVFIDTVLSTGMTREQGAEHSAGRGWRAMSEGDVKTAIKRFNQAWLLDPDNSSAFWGFGVVLHARDGLCGEAFEMFEKALLLGVDSPNFFVEYGRVCEECGLSDRAIPLFRKGLSMDPAIRDGYIGLILAYGRKGDFEQVRHWSEQGAAHGFVPALSLEEAKAFVLKLKERG